MMKAAKRTFSDHMPKNGQAMETSIQAPQAPMMLKKRETKQKKIPRNLLFQDLSSSLIEDSKTVV